MKIHFENLKLPCYLFTFTGKTQQNNITQFTRCVKDTQGAKFFAFFPRNLKRPELFN